MNKDTLRWSPIMWLIAIGTGFFCQVTLASEIKVYLQTYHNTWLTAEGGGGSTLRDYHRPAGWQTFFIVPVEGADVSCLKHGDKVALKTVYGNYVRAFSDGRIDAEPTWLRSWETMTLQNKQSTTACLQAQHQIGFKTHWGRFLQAKPDGTITNEVSHFKEWETFTFLPFDTGVDIARYEDYERHWSARGKTIGGNGGGAFDDLNTIKGELASIKPETMTIRSGNRVDAYSITYNNGATTGRRGGNGGGEYTIHFGNEEFINKIWVCESTHRSPRIGKMTIYTTYGKEYTFGRDCDRNAHTWQFEDDRHIIGFRGRSGDEIDRLEPIVAHKVFFDTVVDIENGLFDRFVEDTAEAQNITHLNDSNITSSYRVEYRDTKGTRNSTNWSDTHQFSIGITLKAAVEKNVGVFKKTGEFSISTEYVGTWQTGGANENTDMQTLVSATTLEMPANTLVAFELIRLDALWDYPFNITYTNRYDGVQFRTEGVIEQVVTKTQSSSALAVGTIDENKVISVHPAYMTKYGCYHGKTALTYRQCDAQVRNRSNDNILGLIKQEESLF